MKGRGALFFLWMLTFAMVLLTPVPTAYAYSYLTNDNADFWL